MSQLLEERRIAEYEELIRQFNEKINGLDLKGIPEPHLPVFGQAYERSKFKFAFCGMETLGWGRIEDFVKRDPEESVFASDYTINDLEYLDYPQNYHATFWGFVLKFLSKFYDVPFEQLKNSNSNILRSFIWMNANSIERYEVTANKENANYDSWQKVKEASLPFDDLNHVLRVASPKVVFILYSRARNDYYLNLKDMRYGLNVENAHDYFKLMNKDLHYQYFYRRDTGTHIFNMPHPRYMGLYSGRSIDDYVQSIMADIKNYHVWDILPGNDTDANYFNDDEPYCKDSIEFKRKFVADIAKTLVMNNCVMSGIELRQLLKRNDIYNYSDNDSRGVYRTIASIWKYYHDDIKDYQAAYFIARAFVKQNGCYAYY